MQKIHWLTHIADGLLFGKIDDCPGTMFGNILVADGYHARGVLRNPYWLQPAQAMPRVGTWVVASDSVPQEKKVSFGVNRLSNSTLLMDD